MLEGRSQVKQLSVIIPVYNTGVILNKTIQSVMMQNWSGDCNRR